MDAPTINQTLQRKPGQRAGQHTSEHRRPRTPDHDLADANAHRRNQTGREQRDRLPRENARQPERDRHESHARLSVVRNAVAEDVLSLVATGRQSTNAGQGSARRAANAYTTPWLPVQGHIEHQHRAMFARSSASYGPTHLEQGRHQRAVVARAVAESYRRCRSPATADAWCR